MDTHTHTHTGEWVNDMKAGFGTMHYPNGDVYEGDWSGDVKHGHGTMHWYSSKQQYEGLWAKNKPNGVGTHVWFQQQVTEPSPANHALMLMFNRWAERGLCVCEGGIGGLGDACCLETHKRHTQAPAHARAHTCLPANLHTRCVHTLHYSRTARARAHTHTLRRYYGHFVDGRRSGYGVLYYATGARYEGYWSNDKKEGEGCYVFENGEVGYAVCCVFSTPLCVGKGGCPLGNACAWLPMCAVTYTHNH